MTDQPTDHRAEAEYRLALAGESHDDYAWDKAIGAALIGIGHALLALTATPPRIPFATSKSDLDGGWGVEQANGGSGGSPDPYRPRNAPEKPQEPAGALNSAAAVDTPIQDPTPESNVANDLEQIAARFRLAQMAGADADDAGNGWTEAKRNAVIRSWQDIPALVTEAKQRRHDQSRPYDFDVHERCTANNLTGQCLDHQGHQGDHQFPAYNDAEAAEYYADPANHRAAGPPRKLKPTAVPPLSPSEG